MKRLASSDSLGGLISLCSSADEKATTANATSGNMYNRGGFQHILDGLEEEAGMEDSGGHIAEKKRRLSVEQVKALEKNFEVENKLEPERKVKLAQELSLQPRQVAVWFQNRRARWKTKQLEKDYSVLKANYDSLKLNFNALQHDKEALMAELQELKGKLKDKNEQSCNGPTIKEEISQETGLETEEATNLASDQSENKASFVESKSLNNEDLDNNSDSSAVLDDNSPQHNVLSSGAFNNPMVSSSSASSLINCFEFSDMRAYGGGHKGYQHQFLRMEEHNFLSSGEESCNFFSDEQAPSLPWYCGEPWN